MFLSCITCSYSAAALRPSGSWQRIAESYSNAELIIYIYIYIHTYMIYTYMYVYIYIYIYINPAAVLRPSDTISLHVTKLVRHCNVSVVYTPYRHYVCVYIYIYIYTRICTHFNHTYIHISYS